MHSQGEEDSLEKELLLAGVQANSFPGFQWLPRSSALSESQLQFKFAFVCCLLWNRILPQTNQLLSVLTTEAAFCATWPFGWRWVPSSISSMTIRRTCPSSVLGVLCLARCYWGQCCDLLGTTITTAMAWSCDLSCPHRGDLSPHLGLWSSNLGFQVCTMERKAFHLFTFSHPNHTSRQIIRACWSLITPTIN